MVLMCAWTVLQVDMSSEADTTSATGTVATPTKAAAPAPSTGSTPSTPSKEGDDARILLVQGRRHLLVKDYFSAVAALAKGCELLAHKYGDTAPELGDAYLTYGRALLELARSESGVLGMNEEGETENEADGDGEDDEEEEGGEDGEEDEEEDKDGAEGSAELENGAEKGKDSAEDKKEAASSEKEASANGKTEANGEAETNGKAETSEPKTNGETSNGVTEDGKEAGADQTIKEEEEEDDVNNLQLAWEVLELAKGIFQKQLEAEEEVDVKANSLKLAEVYLKLGEVGVESENYTTAVDDMKKCLELQRKYLQNDDRRVAETLYNMGMAYSLANEFDSAIEQYKAASEQIESRISNLEKKKAEPTSENNESSDDPFYTIEGEIEELKALLPEIKEKVSDMQDFKKETVRRMMEGMAEASAQHSSRADGAGPSSSSDKPVSSVAHLVKRKPKDETAATEKKSEEKVESKLVGVEKEEVKTESTEITEKADEDVASNESEDKRDSSCERKRKQEESSEVKDVAKKAKVDESES
ncbi:Nuclear autoantigenic sperm protein [Frankliniella fusca]|uniref:Nuclear autoantigenic sperm protein n=1 Tax=Frankliniella fusca TaxID=407009 RepID=A0AAE1LA20_9NEOP|nr:Nuclear autoantigenic sperm protein [Frankliniella fusca]